MQLTNIVIKGNIINDILSNPSVQDQIEKDVKEQFELQKAKAIKEFDDHDVTKELLNPEDGNKSETLGGYGDLFGFIGFNAGFDPISPVRLALQSKIKFKNTNLSIIYPRNAKGQFATGTRTKELKINIQVPDLDDFAKASKFEDMWTGGRNWVKGIERGISGVPYYADYPRGRSERGLQLRGPIEESSSETPRPSSFTTRPYITEIIDNFKKNFTNNTE